MKNGKIIFSIFSMALIMSMGLVLASNQGGKVIATQNQLQTNYQNQYQLSGGDFITANLDREQAQVKVREKIQQRFKIQNCSCENIQVVELQDVQNQTRIAYQVIEDHEGKIFGLFKKKIQIMANVDIETGEVISMKQPWYMWMMRFTQRSAN